MAPSECREAVRQAECLVTQVWFMRHCRFVAQASQELRIPGLLSAGITGVLTMSAHGWPFPVTAHMGVTPCVSGPTSAVWEIGLPSRWVSSQQQPAVCSQVAQPSSGLVLYVVFYTFLGQNLELVYMDYIS